MNNSNQEINLYQTLRSTFGFDVLRPGQEQVIQTVLDNRSCAAIFPTGSGKSLCYQLPAVILPHLTLVVSPLLALMKDQLDFLHSKGIPAASIDSTLTREQIQQVMESARQGQIKVLMISVERLKNERFRQFISQVPISLMVVDEAHCISEWGHNFRPDYLKLPHYLREFNIPQTLLLTATATRDVINDMQEKFSINESDVVVTGFYRPNLDLSVTPCEGEDKAEALLSTIAPNPTEPTIVYVTLQSTAESVAQLLQQSGINAQAYHAGLANELREQIQRAFMQGEIDCIIATIAFGMGVDKSDIRRVIHYDLPKSIENYAQEIGRAGRDGKTSQCVLLANKDGICTLENFVYGDTPELDEITHIVELANQAAPQWEVVLSRLATESNIRQLPLKTLLVYMEMAGHIESQYSYFADYRFKFIMNKQSIIDHFNEERRDFITAVFNCSPQAKTWCQVDFETLWTHFKGDRQRAIAALDYFHEKGWIELESKLITEVYRVKPLADSLDTYSRRLEKLYKDKEHSDIGRIHNLLALFESDQCLSYNLANYFGDNKAPKNCGHCSVCRGAIASLPMSQPPEVHEDQIHSWLTELEQKSANAISTHLKAKFLCGITTPALTKLKARSLSGFGKMMSIPYSDVLQKVASRQQSEKA
ncbi:RecQ family ATP-dependent DNA helicase [Vibrio japonicus]|uniref:ATP-dependent DNA helicase RecQ n=1 Tax=Vibrio japonicus TaxID=1824638 RepID=A0ABY5LGI2_9VIBR|nr:ATP-dependent DNA helicase RecQ [Vibrio japonicus]UUM31153.1 RecQ family ATP-dependent DNA helicase [Vibrio japonicus]